MPLVKHLGTGEPGALPWDWLWESPSNREGSFQRLTSWICGVVSILILMETLFLLEEMYYCNVCSHSLCIWQLNT